MAKLENDIAINYLHRLISLMGVDKKVTAERELAQAELITNLLQLQRAYLRAQKVANRPAELVVAANGFPEVAGLLNNLRTAFLESAVSRQYKKRLAVTWLTAIANHSLEIVSETGKILDYQNRYVAFDEALSVLDQKVRNDIEAICESPTAKETPIYQHPKYPGLLITVPGIGLSALKPKNDHFARKYIDSETFSEADQTFGSKKRTVDLENLPVHHRFPIIIFGHLRKNPNEFQIHESITPPATAFARYKGSEEIMDKTGSKYIKAKPRQVYSSKIAAPITKQIQTITGKNSLYGSYPLDNYPLGSSWLNIDFSSLSSKSVDFVIGNFNHLIDLTNQTIAVAQKIAKNLTVNPTDLAIAQQLINLVNSLEDSQAKTEIQDSVRRAFTRAGDLIRSPL